MNIISIRVAEKGKSGAVQTFEKKEISRQKYIFIDSSRMRSAGFAPSVLESQKVVLVV